MRSPSVKPSAYPALPFHLIRALGFLSSLIPQTPLGIPRSILTSSPLLITSVLSLLNYILTAITHCTSGLSPRLSLVCNSILFILWLISLGLLSWSMANTITTTCNATYWATATGIAVCRIYKVLFSFTVVGAAAHVAAIALDVIVHKRQTRLGRYDPMSSNAALPDYKTHDRSSSIMSGAVPAENAYMMADHPHAIHPGARPEDYDDDARSPLYPHAAAPSHQRHPSQQDFYDIPDPAERQSRYAPPSYESAAPLEQHHAGEAQHYYGDVSPVRSERDGPRVRFSGYGHPGEDTRYDPGAYR
ncbi:hypothetical protein HFD88_008676 [Aspergillus terreus]|nr:hypothetical protein HFD88_008676 [Aspergillus terreus]